MILNGMLYLGSCWLIMRRAVNDWAHTHAALVCAPLSIHESRSRSRREREKWINKYARCRHWERSVRLLPSTSKFGPKSSSSQSRAKSAKPFFLVPTRNILLGRLQQHCVAVVAVVAAEWQRTLPERQWPDYKLRYWSSGLLRPVMKRNNNV